MPNHCMSTYWGEGVSIPVGKYELMENVWKAFRQNYMHDISSVDLLDEKDQIASLLVVGNSALDAFVVDSIHLIGFGTIKSKLCLLRDTIALNHPVSVT